MRQIQVADLTASANEIDNRMGPIPGRSSDRIANELRWAASAIERLLKEHAARPPAAPVESLEEMPTDLRFVVNALKDRFFECGGHMREMSENEAFDIALALRRAKKDHEYYSAASEPVAYQMTDDNGEWLDPMPVRKVAEQTFKRRYGEAIASGRYKLRPLFAVEPQAPSDQCAP